MIPEEHKNSVVVAGLHFMRAITDAYGADDGLRLWETIAGTLDPDVKGQIFLAMLTGTHNDTIVLRDVAYHNNGVACIKEIRTWTGYGLKEAKDTLDLVRVKPVQIKVKPTEHHRAVAALRGVGFVI